MKIGFFSNSYHPMVSGVVKAIDFMRLGLKELGHETYVITAGYPGFKECDPCVIRYPSIALGPAAKFPLAIPFQPALDKKIQNLNLDLVHTQHPFLLGETGARLAHKQKIPLVFTFHTRYDDYLHYTPFGIPQFISKSFIKNKILHFLKKSDAIIAPTPSIKELILQYGIQDKCQVIPNAISLSQFQKKDGKSVLEKYHLEGRKVSVFIGRLAPEKNLSFLLESFVSVVQEISEACLMVIGDGVSRAELEQEAQKLGLARSVIFTGMIPYEQVPDYLSLSKIFVTASKSEVNPLSILEAMAAGVPLLALRTTWSEEIITHKKNGILADENRDSFSRAFIQLLTHDTAREKLSQEAKEKSREFHYSFMAKKLEKLYLSLMQS